MTNKETRAGVQATNIKWGSHFLCFTYVLLLTAGQSVILAGIVRVLTNIWTYFKQIFLTYATVYLHLICSFTVVSLNPHVEFPTCPYKPFALLYWIHWDSSLPHCFMTSIYGSRTAARKKNGLILDSDRTGCESQSC